VIMIPASSCCAVFGQAAVEALAKMAVCTSVLMYLEHVVRLVCCRQELEDALATAAADHSRKMADVTRRHADQVAMLQQQHRSDQEAAQALLQQSVSEWAAKHAAELGRMNAQMDAGLSALQAKHDALVAEMDAARAAKEEAATQATSALQQQNMQARKALEELGAQKAAVDAALEATKDALAKKAMDMTEALYRLDHPWRQCVNHELFL
jgi:NADH dehydrogenase/NADH:ubiquinone oxidoreductase subunit G